MKKNATLLFLLFLFVSSFYFLQTVKTSYVPNVVISEVKVSSNLKSSDESAEFYNNSDVEVDLNGWKLYKFTKMSTSSEDAILLADFSGKKISAKSYFLVAHSDYEPIDGVIADLFFVDGGTIADDNAIFLVDEAGQTVDLVGYGDATAFEGEGSATNPTKTESIQRKSAGDIFVDTENNFSDFERGTPTPKNSSFVKYVNAPPVALLNISQNSAYVEEEIYFDASFSTDDLELNDFSWDFGDGEIGFGATTTHSFALFGEYSVVLTVKDIEGLVGTASSTVQIFQKEEAEQEKEVEIPKLIINEILPNPNSGEDEWVEIYNFSSSSADLADWSLSDNSSTSTLSGTLASFSYFVSADLRLNNSGDVARLFYKNDLADEVYFGDFIDEKNPDGDLNAVNPEKGNSIARNDFADTDNNSVDFKETTVPTRGNENQISAPAPETNNQTVNVNNTFVYTYENTPNTTQNTNNLPRTGSIVLNELLPNPSGVETEDEFIEIYNADNKIIDLSGWKFVDGAGKSFEIENQSIEPLEFLVFKREKTGIALNNSGSESLSFYGYNGVLADKINYDETAKEDWSYAKFEKGWEWTKKATQGDANVFEEEKILMSPTEEKETEILTEDETEEEEFEDFDGVGGNEFLDVELVILNEIFPNPEGSDSDEFIELYNPSGFEINIGGLKLDDEEGGSKPFTIPENTIIHAGQYLVFSKTETKIALNNNGDKAGFLYPDGSVISEIVYEKAVEGLSYSLADNGWKWSLLPTPNEENQIVAGSSSIREGSEQNKKTTSQKVSKQYIETSLEDVKNMDAGDLVRLRGTVAVLPNVLGSQYFYVVGSPGLQIYMNSKDFPQLAVGDFIEVKGELSEAYGETRLKVKEKNDINLVAHSGEPKPVELNIDEIGENYEGWLVKVAGEITEIKSTYLYLDDGSEEIKIYFKKGTNLNGNGFEAGDLLSVAGIVAPTRDGGYQILPRGENDLEKTGKSSIENSESKNDFASIKSGNKTTKNDLEKYLLVAIVFLSLAVLALFVQTYKEKIRGILKKNRG